MGTRPLFSSLFYAMACKYSHIYVNWRFSSILHIKVQSVLGTVLRNLF